MASRNKMHSYMMCKTRDLSKLIRSAITNKYCHPTVGEFGKNTYVEEIGLIFVQKLIEMLPKLNESLRNKIVSYAMAQLFTDMSESEKINAIRESNSCSTIALIKSVLRNKGIFLTDRYIRVLQRNARSLMKPKLKNISNRRLSCKGKKAWKTKAIPRTTPFILKMCDYYESTRKCKTIPYEKNNATEGYDTNIHSLLKNKGCFAKNFRDIFSIDRIRKKSVSVKSILRKLYMLKTPRNKVIRHTTVQRKSTDHRQKNFQKGRDLWMYTKTLLKRKGLTFIPRIVVYILYTYKKILTMIEKRKNNNTQILKPYRISTDVCTRLKRLVEKQAKLERNIPRDVVQALCAFQTKANTLIRRRFKYKQKRYLERKAKQNDNMLCAHINELLKFRKYNSIHRSFVNELIIMVLPLMKSIGKGRVDRKKLSIFVKMILRPKYSRFPSVLGEHHYFMDFPPINKRKLFQEECKLLNNKKFLCESNRISNSALDKLIHFMTPYIKTKLGEKSAKKGNQKRHDMGSIYKIRDPELLKFYKYVLTVTQSQPSSSWKLRKRILQYGGILKNCGRGHKACLGKKAKKKLVMKKNIHDENKNQKIASKENRPLYRPECERRLHRKPQEKKDHFKKNNDLLLPQYSIPSLKPKIPNSKELLTKVTEEEKCKPKTREETKSSFHMINVNKVYQFKSCLHRGIYGSVNKYYSKILKKDVAIKIISKVKVPVEMLLKFVPRAFSVISRLNHPNIIKFHEAFENGVKLYLVMEVAEQGSLTNYIKNRGRLDPIIYHKFFSQIVDAIYYCTQQRVFHRKISCDNILVTKNNDIKLCDFMYARDIDSHKELYETYCGVLAYTAPEILECRPYSPFVTEVWSIGVVVYAMVYGVLPFNPTSYTSLLKQVNTKLEFKRYPDTSFAVINLMHNMIAPLKLRLDLMMLMDDPWLFKQESFSEKEDYSCVKENSKPWPEITHKILELKENLQEQIIHHIMEFATDSEFEKLERRMAKKPEYIPEKMKWTFNLYC